MDRAAKRVFEEVPDVVVGFGESDEYRCVSGCAVALGAGSANHGAVER